MTYTVTELVAAYEERIVAVLERWREACLAKNWPTSEIGYGFEKLPWSGNPVYSWSFDADVEWNRKAHVKLILESETAWMTMTDTSRWSIAFRGSRLE